MQPSRVRFYSLTVLRHRGSRRKLADRCLAVAGPRSASVRSPTATGRCSSRRAITSAWLAVSPDSAMAPSRSCPVPKGIGLQDPPAMADPPHMRPNQGAKKMKRLAITALAVLSLAIIVAGCGSSKSTTPPPQKAGWTAGNVETLLASVEKESHTPPLTETQAKCATAFITEHYTPGELGVLPPPASAKLGQEAKAACGVH
jgi:hypothetical protein